MYIYINICHGHHKPKFCKRYTLKMRKESIHNTKGSHQIMREENKKRKKIELQKQHKNHF